jgi:hypothetical protein
MQAYFQFISYVDSLFSIAFSRPAFLSLRFRAATSSSVSYVSSPSLDSSSAPVSSND